MRNLRLPPADMPALIPLNHAAELTGLRLATLYDLSARGEIETVRVGRRVYVRRRWLEQLLNGEQDR